VDSVSSRGESTREHAYCRRARAGKEQDWGQGGALAEVAEVAKLGRTREPELKVIFLRMGSSLWSALRVSARNKGKRNVEHGYQRHGLAM